MDTLVKLVFWYAAFAAVSAFIYTMMHYHWISKQPPEKVTELEDTGFYERTNSDTVAFLQTLTFFVMFAPFMVLAMLHCRLVEDRSVFDAILEARQGE